MTGPAKKPWKVGRTVGGTPCVADANGEPIAYLINSEGSQDSGALLAAAPALLDAIGLLVEWIEGVETGSYCEVCEAHAKKDEAGRVVEDLVHFDDCVLIGARVAMAQAVGRKDYHPIVGQRITS